MKVKDDPSKKKKKSLNDILIPYMPNVDKLYHLFVGFIVSAFSFILDLLLIQLVDWYSIFFFTVALPLSIGFAKEYHGKYIEKTSKWCWIDILYTMAFSIGILMTILFT
jgi:hypothetical protein